MSATLFTSDTESKTAHIGKRIKIYAGVTLFVFVFGTVYEHFGHGIYSFYMQFAFLFPLVFGVVLPLLFSFLRKEKTPERKPGALYDYGVTVLTAGSVVKGILDIYGTSSPLVLTYFIVGPVMVVCGIIIPFFAKKSVKD